MTVSIILVLIVAIIGLVFFLRMMKKAGQKAVSAPVPFEAFSCPRCKLLLLDHNRLIAPDK